jgi:AcrR family transcriptional regulator
MSKISLKKGRVNQKLLTRTAILQAAKKLMTRNKKISLEDVADKANVSRATIYRYFPEIELLMTEASLDVHHLSPDELLEKIRTMPMNKRIFFIQKYYNQLAQDHEILFRRYLSAALLASVTSKKKVRGARRIESLKKATVPFKKELTNKQYENLINISSILMGIDSFITAKDVCGLDTDQAKSTLEWGLEMVIKGVYSDRQK